MVRAAVISFAVFSAFARGGEVIFEDIMQIRFLSFQVFGGIVFMVTGIRLLLNIGPLT
jgi:small neutral amino acid transporter SnatA (MarC family)